MSASSFLYTGIRRALFQSVKVSPRLAQNENRPVKGETMAGSASFDSLAGMSSGPADLFGLIAFSLRRTESSHTVLAIIPRGRYGCFSAVKSVAHNDAFLPNSAFRALEMHSK